MNREFDGCLLAMILIPILCIVGIAAMISTQIFINLHWFVAFLIALPLGFLAVAISVALQGNDALDVIVGSLLALLFCFILLPVFARARENAQRNLLKKQKMELRQKRSEMPRKYLQAGRIHQAWKSQARILSCESGRP